MNPNYPEVAERASFRCEYCHAPEAVYNGMYDVEHIQPRSQGGNDNEANLALACKECNSHKASATTGWDEATETTVRLFNPRQDVWEEHFAVDVENARLTGLSPIGRATIVRLRFNDEWQVRARRLWIALNIFP